MVKRGNLSWKPFSEAHGCNLSELAAVSNKMAWSSASFAVQVYSCVAEFCAEFMKDGNKYVRVCRNVLYVPTDPAPVSIKHGKKIRKLLHE
jgi:hypothetical protein